MKPKTFLLLAIVGFAGFAQAQPALRIELKVDVNGEITKEAVVRPSLANF